MLFGSAAFSVFFPVVFALYWLLRSRVYRQRLLLLASLFFYGYWDYRFIALLAFVTLVAYAFGKAIRRSEQRKSTWLALAVTLELSQLVFFKYALFVSEALFDLLAVLGLEFEAPQFSLVLPVGISFYTFQAISYLVDVRRGVVEEPRNLEGVALYIAFFPQLVAGPILRADQFLSQLDEDKRLSSEDVLIGLKLCGIGLLYKSVFADRIAVIIDPVFASPQSYDGSSLAGAALGFYSQIYFDFAGYSTMAIGLSRLLGFRLPKNFDFPYRATSVTAFWRRWHISLSTWLRDYLYIPLGGNRQGKFKQYRNLFLTMLLGGLWHGASYNFLVWGAVHGAALAIHKLFSETVAQRPLPRLAWLVLAWALTQCFVLLTWIPFRCESVRDSLDFLSALTALRTEVDGKSIEWSLILWLPVVCDHLLTNNPKLPAFPWPRHAWLIAGLLGACFALALTLTAMQAKTFIYFQF